MTSSGTTTDLETYDFGYKTDGVNVAAVFSEPGQTITISEVRTALPNKFGFALGLSLDAPGFARGGRPSRTSTAPPGFWTLLYACGIAQKWPEPQQKRRSGFPSTREDAVLSSGWARGGRCIYRLTLRGSGWKEYLETPSAPPCAEDRKVFIATHETADDPHPTLHATLSLACDSTFAGGVYRGTSGSGSRDLHLRHPGRGYRRAVVCEYTNRFCRCLVYGSVSIFAKWTRSDGRKFRCSNSHRRKLQKPEILRRTESNV